MLGRLVEDSASCSLGVSEAEVSDPEKLVTKRSKTARHPTTIARSVLLLALKDLSPLLTIRELLPRLGWLFFDAERLGTRRPSLTSSSICVPGRLSHRPKSTKLQRRFCKAFLGWVMWH